MSEVWRLQLHNIIYLSSKEENKRYHAMVKSENANITSMMNVIPSDNGISMVFNPNSC